MRDTMRAITIVLLLAGSAESAEPPRTSTTAAELRATPAPPAKRWWSLRPHLAVVAALNLELLGGQQGTRDGKPIEDTRENRLVTLALSRFGFSGSFGEHVYLKSLFEASFGRHGTSVWEGQAAFQIREQVLGLRRWKLGLEAGRILDAASVDHTSAHVADLLLQDPFTHTPLLEAGYNLGYGAQARYEPFPWLRAALTFNAANPASMTSSYLVQGKFSHGLYARLHDLAAARIADSADKSPTPNLHMLVLTPSLLVAHRLIEAQAALQVLWVNLDTNVPANDPSNDQSADILRGANLRAGLRLHLAGDRLQPFANLSYLVHQMPDYLEHPLWVWPDHDWQVLTVTAGADLNLRGRSGLGAQYSFIHSREGDGSVVRSRQHFVNAGASLWFGDHVAASLRFAFWHRKKIDLVEKVLVPEEVTERETSLYLALRVEL